MKTTTIGATAALALMAVACSDHAALEPHLDLTPAPAALTIQVKPLSRTIGAGGSRQFSAEVTDSDAGVTWSATGGSVDETGFYTAPLEPDTYYVIATSIEEPGIADSSRVIVPPIAVIPSVTDTTTKTGRTIRLTAQAKPAVNNDVTWSADSGTIVVTSGNAMRYTAPMTPGTYHVTATSVLDPTKSAVITVLVQPIATIRWRGTHCTMNIRATASVQQLQAEEVSEEDVYEYGGHDSGAGCRANLPSSYDASASAGWMLGAAASDASGSFTFHREALVVTGSVNAYGSASASVEAPTDEHPHLISLAGGHVNIDQATTFEVQNGPARLTLNASLDAGCDFVNNEAFIRLETEDGDEIDGVEVECQGDGGGVAPRRAPTDDEVVIRTYVLEPGTYRVVAGAEGHGSGTGFAVLPADPNTSWGASSSHVDYTFRLTR